MSLNEPSRLSLLFHDFLTHNLLRPYYRRFVETFGLTSKDRVLDFGCASGALSRHVAQRLREGGGEVMSIVLQA